MRVRSILLNLLCLTLLMASPAWAQQGTIIGTVADETKAALPGANVTATDQATGRAITAVTDERGEYRLVNVPPGKYTILA
ncbi:MAG TPA: carboxypeptidase-like regulatory domain-containing protein, partial [Vicinamibacterales bacterium]|nr:carboxypeptidase-like regulatory domain-containing protein [Vicinamibacterales bacterium]